MPVHVAIGGESLSTKHAGEGPLPAVDQHVPVEAAEGGQHLTAEAAVVHLGLASRVAGVGAGLDLVVASQVAGELLLVGHDLAADGALVVALHQVRAQLKATLTSGGESGNLGLFIVNLIRFLSIMF